MPFRRFLVLALILSTAIGVYAVTHHSSTPADSTSPDILITPTVLETAVPVIATLTVIPTPIPVVSSAHKAVSTPLMTATMIATYSYSVATAADVIDLKKIRSKEVTVDVHKVDFGENYWTLAKKADIDIYTLIGANPTMPFKAAYHMTLNILSRKGVLHTVHPGDTLTNLAEKYRTTEKVIQDSNQIHW